MSWWVTRVLRKKNNLWFRVSWKWHKDIRRRISLVVSFWKFNLIYIKKRLWQRTRCHCSGNQISAGKFMQLFSSTVDHLPFKVCNDLTNKLQVNLRGMHSLPNKIVFVNLPRHVGDPWNHKTTAHNLSESRAWEIKITNVVGFFYKIQI